MCHPANSLPPTLPGERGEVAVSGAIRLTATDGNRLRAYRATPARRTGTGVVILTDARGLHPYYEALARRFAEAGADALAVDPYGRTAGAEPRGPSFDGIAHLPLLRPEHVDADVDAAVELLRSTATGPVFTVGFCLGGGHSWRQAARPIGLAGAVGFYGPPRFFGDATDDLSAPLLLLLAGDDVATPPEEFRALAEGFDRAGKDYEMHVYEDAPHSFFDVGCVEWQESCADAWRRTLGFLARHGGPARNGAA